LVFAPFISSMFVASAADIKLITLDPGHFHAALFQREMLPGVAGKAYVYLIGPDLPRPQPHRAVQSSPR
jgi:hypothetical protein